jgi:hypothetical protein
MTDADDVPDDIMLLLFPGTTEPPTNVDSAEQSVHVMRQLENMKVTLVWHSPSFAQDGQLAGYLSAQSLTTGAAPHLVQVR